MSTSKETPDPIEQARKIIDDAAFKQVVLPWVAVIFVVTALLVWDQEQNVRKEMAMC